MERDEGLREYATKRQWEVLCAYWEHGTARKAAKAMGIAHQNISSAIRAVQRKAALRGYNVREHTNDVPDGYKVRGVSTLYDQDENIKLQWVKTSEDRERQLELLQQIIEASADDITRSKPTKRKTQHTKAELCAVYPVGDHHFGMYAWHEEAVDNYNLEIAEDVLTRAFVHLIGTMGAGAESAVIPLLGDLLHYDSLKAITPEHGNLLDADSRYGEVVRVVVRTLRRVIKMALEEHENVTVIVQPGNHDPSSSLMLSECLAAMHDEDPRVTVDTSPAQFHYYRHGKCLLGICHGHEVRKLDQLPLIMATDRPQDWGETKFRYWYSGHVHHDQAKDVAGTRVESFNVLAATDAFAHGKGYRSRREMKGVILHSDFGEVQRTTVNPDMFKADT